MWTDRVSNPGPLTYESGALLTALRGPARDNRGQVSSPIGDRKIMKIDGPPRASAAELQYSNFSKI